MEEKDLQESNSINLLKCPFCPCCFCSASDLQRHLKAYGNSKAEHLENFRKDHGRLEHGFNDSE